MKLSKLFRLSILELLRYKSATVFLILNLCFGLIGFFLIQVFQQSLNLQLAEKAQVILGGDLSISARRAFRPDEIKEWESKFQYNNKSHFYSMFSMLRSKEDSKLVNVFVFDENYPLYGVYKFSDIPGFLPDKPYVWVDPEVQDLLNLQLSQKVSIGEAEFEFAGAIVEDPSRIFRNSFAPQVLIHRKYLNKTGLIKPGSTFTEYLFYKLDAGSDLKSIQLRLLKKIDDPFVRVKITSDKDNNSTRVIQYFTDYLGLVALVALGLCFLSSNYLLQWIFLNKKKSIAIYKTLGMTNAKIITLNFIQSLIISVLSSVAALAIVRLSIPYFQHLIEGKFDLPLVLVLAPKALLITGLIAVLGPLFMVVPQMLQIINLRPLMLLQNVEVRDYKKRISYFLWLILIGTTFWVLSVWQSHSLKIGSIFFVCLVGLIIIFYFINRLFMGALEKLSSRFNWLVKYSVKGLARRHQSTGLVFTTMSLATLVLSLLPHLKTSIVNEVRPENSQKLPALFMFDIQPDQVDGLKKMAHDILNQELVLSPLVRSRILKVNDKPYERVVLNDEIRSREDEEDARFRNRGINLTYRTYLQESEILAEGSFSGVVKENEIPQISLEKKYAKNMGIRLRDTVTFDVQGVEVLAQVSSFRQVRWTSFQPNFFILFPDGVLEDAPQVFLTSATSPKTADAIERLKNFQRSIAKNFSNISIIDIRRTVENSLVYIDQMSWGLQFMAWLAVVLGVLVFLILLNTQIRERLQEMNLLQIMGSSSKQILQIVLLQFFILIAVSVVFGVLLGLISAHILITVIFDVQTVFDINYLVLLVCILTPILVLALYWGLKPLKKLNPMDLIRQNS